MDGDEFAQVVSTGPNFLQSIKNFQAPKPKTLIDPLIDLEISGRIGFSSPVSTVQTSAQIWKADSVGI